MDNLEQLLEEFEKTGDVEAVIASGLNLDPDVLQTYLQGLPADKQEHSMKILTDLTDALNRYIDDTSKEMGDIKQQIEKASQSTQACLSYGSAQGLGPQKRKESGDDHNE